MTPNIKTTLLVLTLIASTIWLTECKRSNPSIVGTWTKTSARFWQDSNNVIVFDNTFTDTISSDSLAFYANGKCVIGRSPYPYHTIYTSVGNIVFINDTVGFGPTQHIDTIVSLTEHSLVLSPKSDTAHVITGNDTIIYANHYTLEFSR